jgi:hypothetical protein
VSTDEPQSKGELLHALNHLCDEGLQFWADLAPDLFVSPYGNAWSPADNLRHLIKSTTPVSRALALPASALETMFGRASEPSASYVALRDRYRSLLAGGVDAGEYAPSPVAVPDEQAAWQREIVSACRDALADLATVVARWEDGDLDRYRLPHPLLGALTVREMLIFTVYHYEHHRANVSRRMATSTRPPS